MKLGVILYSKDPEVISNAFKLSSSGLRKGDQVSLFLMGKSVEIESISKVEAYASHLFDVAGYMQSFIDGGGFIYSSSECLTARQLKSPQLCTAITIDDIYDMIRQCDHIITF